MVESRKMKTTSLNFNLIEPTLFDQTGHSYTYTDCLLHANTMFNFNFHIWLDKRGANLFKPNQNTTTHPYFFRKIRQLQKIFLYYKLLKKPQIIFIGTAAILDLIIFDKLISWLKLPTKNIFFHFHQFSQNDKKLKQLKKIAARNHNFIILTTTEKLCNIFQAAGFTNCSVIPCPTYKPAYAHRIMQFNKVLYAGAARKDKGFPHVINTLEYLRAKDNKIPFEIQISKPNSKKYDLETKQALYRLQTLSKNNLTIHSATLDTNQYQALFLGAICLLIYDPIYYHDKFSAIALDALYAGAPLITAKNTWMGNITEKFDAGITLEQYSPNIIQDAILEIKNHYDKYHKNAKYASATLQEIHDPKHTLAFVRSKI